MHSTLHFSTWSKSDPAASGAFFTCSTPLLVNKAPVSEWFHIRRERPLVRVQIGPHLYDAIGTPPHFATDNTPTCGKSDHYACGRFRFGWIEIYHSMPSTSCRNARQSYARPPRRK